MTRHELASFALKLLGIYALLQALPLIQFLGGVLWTLRSGGDDTALQLWLFAGMLLPFALMVLAGIVLLAFSGTLAPRLVGKDEPLGLPGDLSARDVQAMGFSIVGVFIFLRGIPGLGQVITGWSYLATRDYPEPAVNQMVRGLWQDGLSAGIQLLLGAGLFLHARGLANLWHRIQAARYVRIEEAGRQQDRAGS